MKPVLFVAVSAFALMPFVALPAGAQTDPSMVGVSDSQPWNQTGPVFVQNMLMGDKFEIESSQLALEKSHDRAVRDFARDMIAAHSETSTDLKAIADRTIAGRTVTVPPMLDPQHMAMYHALESRFGPAFDREYIAQQFTAHRQALAFMEGYARGGAVPELQDFARHTVPVIRDHLAMLRSIRGDVALAAPHDDVAFNVPSDTTVIEHPDGTTTTVIETE
jgi:putative membrane protein